MGTHVTIDRLKDSTMGKKGVSNICDFTVYNRPYMYYFECKSTNNGTLHFKGAISDNQWDGLIERSYHDGVEAGYLIWFISHDINVFVPSSEMLRLQKEGKKSLHYTDIQEDKVEYVTIPATSRRVLFTYHMDHFLELLEWDKKSILDRRWIPVE